MLIRAKYYSDSNMSLCANLRRAGVVLTTYNPADSPRDINDILDYYNIVRFFDRKLYLPEWDTATIERFNATVIQKKRSLWPTY